jgi:hypothetical protein
VNKQLQLQQEFLQCRNRLTRMDAAVTTEGRALSASEQRTWDETTTRMDAITAEIEGANSGRRPVLPAAVIPGIADAPTGRSAFGELLLVRGQAALGSLGVEKYRGAVADAETLTRVVAHGVAADGTAPVTIEGDLIKFVDGNRYAVHASRQIPMPDNHAPTFKRPRVTQTTQVGTQAAEGDVLASRRLQTTGDTITKVTKGGVLSLSEQEIDWTDPAMLELAVQDLAEQYAVDTDALLCAAIEAKITTNSTDVALDAGPQDFIEATAAAAAAVYTASKKLPNTLYAGTNRWAYLLGLTDDDGRPLFPTIGAQNASGSIAGAGSFGGNVLGLTLVVDPNFDPDTLVVAASSLVEFYEQNKGLLSINAPSTLEVQYAYRGYVAANVYAQGLQALAPAA